MAKPDAMTDTRYSAEELRRETGLCMAEGMAHTANMLRQAAADAETLAGIRAWLEKISALRSLSSLDEEWAACAEAAIYELDRLSRGDA